MVNIRSDLPNWQFAIILVVLCIKCTDAELKPTRSLNLFHFEQMKKDIFTVNRANEFDHENITGNNLECSEELSAIGKGLTNLELWAIKSK